MEKQQIIVQPNENGVLEILTGAALPKREPKIIGITGTICAPLRWLMKRKSEMKMLQAHVLVDREEKTIELKFNETDYFGGSVKGKLEFHPAYLTFGINSGSYIPAFQMAEKIKLNRSFFESSEAAMSLVNALKNIEFKVDTERKAATDNRGTNTQMIAEKVIESNVPERFNLKIPIFKGQNARVIEVEVYFNTKNLECTLVSPEANDAITSEVDVIIDEQLKGFEDYAADIVIIEQ